jgi:integrase
MARSLRAQKLETRTNRLKLPVAKKPVWAKIGHGISLGYRRNNGSGTWSVRVANGKGSHWIKSIGTADDYEDASSGRTLEYWTARERAREVGLGARHVGDEDGDASDGKLATVAQAIDSYEADLTTRNGDAANADRIRCHLPEKLANKTVALLTAQDFRTWRAALTKAKLSAASIVRVNNAFKAALNLASAHDERIANQRAWEKALVSIPDASTARNVILDEPTVRSIIAAAYEVSPEFGLLVEPAAVTGARVSQLGRLEVRDVQASRTDPRVMMPSSKKGKGRKRIERRPVPIPAALAVRLLDNAADRPDDAPLLTKPSGEPWRKSDHTRPFADTISKVVEWEAKRQGVSVEEVTLCGYTPSGVTIYVLRHSNIVRQLLAGVPIRVVAVNHDTSVQMIEKTYSAYIADHSDAVSRQALLDVAEPIRVTNVVPLHEQK